MPNLEEIFRLVADIPYVILRPMQKYGRGNDIDILCRYPYEFIRRLLVPSVWEKKNTKVTKEGKHIHLDFLTEDKHLVFRIDLVRDFSEFEDWLLENPQDEKGDMAVRLMEWSYKNKIKHLTYVKNKINSF